MVSVENGHFLYLETKVLWLGQGDDAFVHGDNKDVIKLEPLDAVHGRNAHSGSLAVRRRFADFVYFRISTALDSTHLGMTCQDSSGAKHRGAELATLKTISEYKRFPFQSDADGKSRWITQGWPGALAREDLCSHVSEMRVLGQPCRRHRSILVGH